MRRPEAAKETLPAALQGRLIAGDPSQIAALKSLEIKRKRAVVRHPWDIVSQKEFVEGLGGTWT